MMRLHDDIQWTCRPDAPGMGLLISAFQPDRRQDNRISPAQRMASKPAPVLFGNGLLRLVN